MNDMSLPAEMQDTTSGLISRLRGQLEEDQQRIKRLGQMVRDRDSLLARRNISVADSEKVTKLQQELKLWKSLVLSLDEALHSLVREYCQPGCLNSDAKDDVIKGISQPAAHPQCEGEEPEAIPEPDQKHTESIPVACKLPGRKKCSIPWCPEPSNCKEGYCSGHTNRWRKYGDPHITRIFPNGRTGMKAPLMREVSQGKFEPVEVNDGSSTPRRGAGLR